MKNGTNTIILVLILLAIIIGFFWYQGRSAGNEEGGNIELNIEGDSGDDGGLY